MAIKSCTASNVKGTKSLILIEDFCETEESDPIVKRHLDGGFLLFFTRLKKFQAKNDAQNFESFRFQIFKFPRSNRRKFSPSPLKYFLFRHFQLLWTVLFRYIIDSVRTRLDDSSLEYMGKYMGNHYFGDCRNISQNIPPFFGGASIDFR